MEGTEGEICLPLLSFDGKRTQTVLEKLTATAVELCVSVRGAARLMAMHYGMVRVCCGVGTPSPCVPVRVDCGRYTLLWRGVGDEILDDTEYTPCPQASVSALLRENAEREIESAGASTPLDEFEWWKGGAMMKFARSPLKKCIHVAWEAAATRLSANKHLQFVYDIVAPDVRFDQLKYVIDAGQKPLSSAPQFSEAYGLDRTLIFRPAELRVAQPHDWWSAVYG